MFPFSNDAVRVAEAFGLRFGLGVRLLPTDARVPAWSINGMIFDFLALVTLLLQRRLLLNPGSVRIAKAAKIIHLQADVRGMCVVANRAIVSRMRDAFERYKVDQTKLILRSIEHQRNGRRGLRDDPETARQFAANFNQFNEVLDPGQTVEQQEEDILDTEEARRLAVAEAEAEGDADSTGKASSEAAGRDEHDERDGRNEGDEHRSKSFSLGALSRSVVGYLPWGWNGDPSDNRHETHKKAASESDALEAEGAAHRHGASGSEAMEAERRTSVHRSVSTSALADLRSPSPVFSVASSGQRGPSTAQGPARRRRSRRSRQAISPVHELSVEDEHGEGTDASSAEGDEDPRRDTEATPERKGSGLEDDELSEPEQGKCKKLCSRCVWL